MNRLIMQQALDALDMAQALLERSRHHDQILNAYKSLREELAKPDQEEKRCQYCDGTGEVHDPDGEWRGSCNCGAKPEQTIVPIPSFMRKRIEEAIDLAINPKGMSVHDGKAAVYASDLQRMIAVIDLAPTPKPWVGLTEDEVNLIYAEPQTHVGQYARAIEAKLRSKNT